MVISVHNESGCIALLIKEIYQTLKDLPPREVIIVDDGSTDDTVAEVSAMMTQYPTLELLCHPHRLGQSAGIVTGATAARGKWIVFSDGDGQNDPRYIPKMFAQLAQPPRKQQHNQQQKLMLVNCVRVKRKSSWLKKAYSFCANWIRRSVLHDDCTDSGCGLKLINREVFLAIPHFRGMHRFIPVLVTLYGFERTEIEIVDRERFSGCSKYTNTYRALFGIFNLFGVYWLSKRLIIPTTTETVKKDSSPQKDSNKNNREPGGFSS
nr:glycosyltransferase family 2 protein [Microbulbifer sp. THAF38]